MLPLLGKQTAKPLSDPALSSCLARVPVSAHQCWNILLAGERVLDRSSEGSLKPPMVMPGESAALKVSSLLTLTLCMGAGAGGAPRQHSCG